MAIIKPTTQATTTPKEYFGDSGFYVGGTTMPQPSARPPRTSDMRVVSAPKLPEPNAPAVFDEFVGTMTNNVALQRKAVEDAYKRQRSEIDLKQKEAQTKVDAFNKKQEGIINGGVKDVLTPFRNELENNERNRLSINKNFEDNQKLVDELDTLLTQSNNMMTQLKSSKIPGLAGISQSPRALQALSDVSARVGVIQAVMDARNGQISQGYNMIDRSVEAINSDRKDRLNYYSTLYDFYQNQKDEEGKKLFQLDQKEEQYIKKQIGLLESDMERSQATADYIKELMINPDSAKFMADAGVTLNDSVETIQKKMATQADIVERKKQAEETKKELFEAGISTAFAIRNGELVRTADGWSFKDPEEFQKMTGMTIEEAQAKGMITEYNADLIASRAQVQALMEKYFDAGIKPGDSLDVAVQKAMGSAIYREQVRPPMGSGGGGGGEIGGENGGIFSGLIDEGLMMGDSPEDAVLNAIAMAEQMGISVDKKSYSSLLSYARSRQGQISVNAGGEEQGGEAQANAGPTSFQGQVVDGMKPTNIIKNTVKFGGDIIKGIADAFRW